MDPLRILAFFSLLMLALGCSKEKMDEMVASAKDTATNVKEKATAVASEVSSDVKSATSDSIARVQSTAESVVEQAADGSGVGDFTGSATMALDETVNFSSSYACLIVSKNRPSVLQIKSNREDELDDRFPAFLLQAQVTASGLEDLHGQAVAARLFAQKTAGGTVWFSEDDQHIDVMITLADGKLLAKFDAAMITNSANLQTSPSSGNFECVVLD